MREYTDAEVASEAWSGAEPPSFPKVNGHTEPFVTFPTSCAFDLDGKIVPERECGVEGVMPHENVTLLTGDGGLGKTLLALQLGASIATRSNWLGIPVMQGPFLYVGAEDVRDP